MTKKNYLITFGLVLTSIFATYFATDQSAQQGTTTRSDFEYQTNAVLYMQKSAEYRAICLQTFKWAKLKIAEDTKNKKKLPKADRNKQRAVIVDIDETMLDNSPAQAEGIKLNRPFSYPGWYAWGDMKKAKAIPGAVDFANFANANGVKVYYISNRDEIQKTSTVENLRLVGFPDITNDNVMLRQKDANGNNISTKEPRRDEIRKTYRVILAVGDNLDDFSSAFEKLPVGNRFAEVEKNIDKFGTEYFVLPNAMYGTWETAIYEFPAKPLSEEQKAEKRTNALELP